MWYNITEYKSDIEEVVKLSIKVDDDKKSPKKGSAGLYVIIGMLLVVVILVLVFGIILITRDDPQAPPSETTTKRRDVVINEDNVEEVVEDIVNAGKDFVAPGNYEVVMNSTWYFENGKSASSNAYVENADTNTHDVYFDVIRDDTQETIYESPVLPRGAYLDKIVLDKELEAGTHNCVLVYHLIDENQNTVSTLRMAIVIVVEN